MPLEVVAALIRRGDRVLICRRPAHKARGGCWEFPGGKIEPGETPAQALRRECREELAVGLSVGKAVADTLYAYPDITVHLTLLAARIDSGAPTALEHSELRFVSPQEFGAYAFCPADTRFLPAVAAYLQNG